MPLIRRLIQLARRPRAILLLAMLVVTLRASQTLLVLVGVPLALASISGTLRETVVLYLQILADRLTVSMTAVWWWYGYGLASSLGLLVLTGCLWTFRPWVRNALFIALGMDALREIIYTAAAWPSLDRADLPFGATLSIGRLLLTLGVAYGLPILILTREPVAHLFARRDTHSPPS